MKSYLDHYIDGAWVASEGGTRHAVINPATEAPCSEITLGSQADVDAAVAAARTAFDSFSRTSVEERVALLEAITVEYKKRAGDMAEAIALTRNSAIMKYASVEIRPTLEQTHSQTGQERPELKLKL